MVCHLLPFAKVGQISSVSLSDVLIVLQLSLYTLLISSAGFTANGKDVMVNFPQQAHWTGLVSEMELVLSTHPAIT